MRYTMRIVDHSKSPFLETSDATLDHKPTGITLTGQGFPALHLLLPIRCHCSEASVGFPCVHIENNMRDQDEEMCEYLHASLPIYCNSGRPNDANLEHQSFSVLDSARTRLQLAQTQTLSDKGAERVMDFCPDEVWQKTLLKIVGETQYGNIRVARRLRENGDLMSENTITKRVQTALGKRQRAKNDVSGEKERVEANGADLHAYQEYHTRNRY